MIDKKIFFFWAGASLSFLRYMTLKSFRHFNPDWEMTLFTCDINIFEKSWATKEQQDFFTYNGKDYLDEINKLDIKIIKWENNLGLSIGPPHIADIFRYKRLQTTSTVYSDMDILYIKPIDELYEEFKYSDTVLSIDPVLRIGFLASSGNNNNFYKKSYLNSVLRYNKENYQSTGTHSVDQKTIDSIEEKFDQKVYNIKKSVFYYYDDMYVKYIYLEKYGLRNIPSEIVGIHWYGGASISQQFNILSKNELLKHNNFLVSEIKKIIAC